MPIPQARKDLELPLENRLCALVKIGRYTCQGPQWSSTVLKSLEVFIFTLERLMAEVILPEALLSSKYF